MTPQKGPEAPLGSKKKKEQQKPTGPPAITWFLSPLAYLVLLLTAVFNQRSQPGDALLTSSSP